MPLHCICSYGGWRSTRFCTKTFAPHTEVYTDGWNVSFLIEQEIHQCNSFVEHHSRASRCKTLLDFNRQQTCCFQHSAKMKNKVPSLFIYFMFVIKLAPAVCATSRLCRFFDYPFVGDWYSHSRRGLTVPNFNYCEYINRERILFAASAWKYLLIYSPREQRDPHELGFNMKKKKKTFRRSIDDGTNKQRDCN